MLQHVQKVKNMKVHCWRVILYWQVHELVDARFSCIGQLRTASLKAKTSGIMHDMRILHSSYFSTNFSIHHFAAFPSVAVLNIGWGRQHDVLKKVLPPMVSSNEYLEFTPQIWRLVSHVSEHLKKRWNMTMWKISCAAMETMGRRRMGMQKSEKTETF